MRSRTKRRWGEVYSPIFWNRGFGWEWRGRYCDSIEETKALVEPFPFVPAMCIRFRRLKSEGCHQAQPCLLWSAEAAGAHTSYPILRTHATISGIASSFIRLRSCLMDSMTAKLLWRVLRAATASCRSDQLCLVKHKMHFEDCGATHRIGAAHLD